MSLRLSSGRRLQSPAGDRARPTAARVREAVMNMLAPRLAGCRWLDLCSGSGVMACEALHHGAIRVDAVEADRRIAAVASANLAAVASSQQGAAGSWQVHRQEVLRWLRERTGSAAAKPLEPYDLIYCDPPYRAGLYQPVAEAVLGADLLMEQGLMLLECASDQMPETPQGWVLEDCRRYGGSAVMLLSCRADCRGGTGSRRP